MFRVAARSLKKNNRRTAIAGSEHGVSEHHGPGRRPNAFEASWTCESSFRLFPKSCSRIGTRIFAAAHFADFARNSRQLPACLAARDLEFDHANVIRFLRTTESRVEFAFRGCGSTFTAAHKFAKPSV